MTLVESNTLGSQDQESREVQRVKHNNYFHIEDRQENEEPPTLAQLFTDLDKIYNSDVQADGSQIVKNWENFVVKYKCLESFLYENKNFEEFHSQNDQKGKYID